ncbi:restriction endonuclease, partial [Methylococcaceae bacterium CS3]
MSIVKHDFTKTIIDILDRFSEKNGNEILKKSEIIQYLNIKTKAANRGSKSRAGFANHYAIYVLIEDYLNGNFSI